jgi:hypothetical protein
MADNASVYDSILVNKPDSSKALPMPRRGDGATAKKRKRCVFGASPNRDNYSVGLMFWLWRNRFVGSYLFFAATSRS